MFNVARHGLGNPFVQPGVGLPIHPALAGLNPLLLAGATGSASPIPWLGSINPMLTSQVPIGYNPIVNPLANPILAQLYGVAGLSGVPAQFGAPHWQFGVYGQSGFPGQFGGQQGVFGQPGVGSISPSPFAGAGINPEAAFAALCNAQINPLAQQLPIRPLTAGGNVNPLFGGGQWIDPYQALLQANPLSLLSRQGVGLPGGYPDVGSPFGGVQGFHFGT